VSAILSVGVAVLLTRPDLSDTAAVALTVLLLALYAMIALQWLRLR
jgi:hypothetical protein